jgi:SEC-C motif-containing protein
MKNKQNNQACPCGGASFETCCGPYLASHTLPATAELLMRSRYSAYVLGDEAYLLATWHASTRPPLPLLEQGTKWLGLEVHAHGTDPDDSNRARVEFVARYKLGGRAHRLHEISRFVREAAADGMRWYYLNGSFPPRLS